MQPRADREQEFCYQRLYYGSGNETKQKFPCNVSGKSGVDAVEMPALRLRKNGMEANQGRKIIERHFGENLLLNEWALFSMKVRQCQGVLQVPERRLDSPTFVVKRTEQRRGKRSGGRLVITVSYRPSLTANLTTRKEMGYNTSLAFLI